MVGVLNVVSEPPAKTPVHAGDDDAAQPARGLDRSRDRVRHHLVISVAPVRCVQPDPASLTTVIDLDLIILSSHVSSMMVCIDFVKTARPAGRAPVDKLPKSMRMITISVSERRRPVTDFDLSPDQLELRRTATRVAGTSTRDRHRNGTASDDLPQLRAPPPR